VRQTPYSTPKHTLPQDQDLTVGQILEEIPERQHHTQHRPVTPLGNHAFPDTLDSAQKGSLFLPREVAIRERRPPDLDTWIDKAARGLLASFAKGLSRDRVAVAAALAEPWSNGQTEGQITRLKLVKRQMYGRAKLDLLEARLIGAG
jgi:hypothetical protein